MAKNKSVYDVLFFTHIRGRILHPFAKEINNNNNKQNKNKQKKLAKASEVVTCCEWLRASV